MAGPRTLAAVELGGDPRMHERPVADLVDALQAGGVAVEYLGKDGALPIRVNTTRRLRGPRIRLSAAVSSQVERLQTSLTVLKADERGSLCPPC